MHIASVKYGMAGGYEVSTGIGQTIHVPNDPENSDYIKVQAWINDGNTPDAADPAPVAPALVQAITDRRAGDPVIDDLFTRLEALEA